MRVGLLWHSPNSGNLGVGALTVANLAIVRQVAAEFGVPVEFTIVGMREIGARYLSEAEARVVTLDMRSLLSPSGAWRVLGEQDCVLDIGAGDSFADIYGFRRFLFLWLTKMIAIARGAPLVLSPQTIGPFTRSPYRQLARFPLDHAHVVVARDDASLECLRELAPSAKGVLSVDVAFALPFQDRRGERGADGRIKVGVNISGLLFGEAQSGRNRFGLEVDYAELMRRWLAYLAARPDIEIHLLTHANGPERDDDDDGWVADLLAAEFPTAVRAPDFASPSAAKSYISSLDFLVAGRMHACIAAYSSGVAVAPVAYSRKFAGLFGMLGYRWMVPVKGMTTDQAFAYLLDSFERRAELVSDAAQGMARVEASLDVYRAELRSLFKSLMAVR